MKKTASLIFIILFIVSSSAQTYRKEKLVLKDGIQYDGDTKDHLPEGVGIFGMSWL